MLSYLKLGKQAGGRCIPVKTQIRLLKFLLQNWAKLFSVTIDHQANCLRFGDEALESESMRDHLRILGRRLASVSNIIHPPDTNAKLERRVTLFNSVRQNLVKEHLAVLERKNEIEKRKEEVERLAQITLKKEIELKAKEEALRQQEEARRLMREKRLRDKQKEQMIQQELDLMKKSKILEDLGEFQLLGVQCFIHFVLDLANVIYMISWRWTSISVSYVSHLVESIPWVQSREDLSHGEDLKI